MLSLEKRIELAGRLGNYLLANDEEWQQAIHHAVAANPWFTPGNIALAANNIAVQMLHRDKLRSWAAAYTLPQNPVRVGIVMAGNIPLVGFHDLLCGFISGHTVMLKLSSKDTVLMQHLVNKLVQWEPAVAAQLIVADMLKDCDAYIATGSNNTARYFEQYFGKYPHIIRRNRTSVAILDGSETAEQLSLLADDIFSYFGLGCRNVTQVCVPQNYDFIPLIEACNKYADLVHHNKYKNNYDYYLAIYLLNKVPYYSNDSLLLVQNDIPFSSVAVLHYRYYADKEVITGELATSPDIQCIVGNGNLPFGQAQSPALTDYADGTDTMAFLCAL